MVNTKDTNDGAELGVAILGAGFMGDTHAYGYRRIRSLRAATAVPPDLRLVVDIDAEAARSLASRWNVPEWSTDWEAVAADDEIDLVDICTPPDMHREIGVAMAAAGKSVYCEKPVGRNVDETAALAAAIRTAGVFGYVGFTYRWTPAVVLAKSLITEGRIGEIREIHIGYQSSPFADANRIWSWKFAKGVGGGGALADQGSHAFDMARFLVGEVARVSGYTHIAVPQRPDPDATEPGAMLAVENDDQWAAFVEFVNGAYGTLHGSRVAHGTATEFGFEAYGARGALKWNIQRMNELEIYEASDDTLDGFRTVRLGPEHPIHGDYVPRRGHSVGFNELKAIEIRGMLTALAEGRTPEPSMEDALAVARISDAVPQQKWVDLKTDTNERGEQ